MVSPKLVLAVLLVFAGVGLAHAEGKVDWSDYLEPPGSRPMQIKHESKAPAATPDDGASRKAAPTKVASKGKAKTASKAKAKAKGGKAKAKARRRR